MALWFETKLRYDKMMENGTVKKVTEPYLVYALSFTEAEARITEEAAPFISGEFTMSSAKKSNISEIFYDESGDRWYRVKVAFITIDENKGTEKRKASYIMVQASDFISAHKRFLEGMKGTMADYEILSISETAIMDVYPAKLEKTNEVSDK